MEGYGAINFNLHFGEQPTRYQVVRGYALWLGWIGLALPVAEMYVGGQGTTWSENPSTVVSGLFGGLNVVLILAGLAALETKVIRVSSVAVSLVVAVAMFAYGVNGYLWSLEAQGQTAETWMFFAGILIRPVGITCLVFLLLLALKDK